MVVSPGNSGGGAIHDYLLSRSDFISPFQGEEFRLITDPYGLENLYKNLYSDFSINNSSEAFLQFERYCYFLSKLKSPKNGRLIYGKNFYNLSLEYLKRIELLSYKGIPQFKRIALSPKKKFFFKIKKRFLRYNNHEHNIYKIRLPIKEKNFFKETKKYLNKIIRSNNKNIQNKNIILDQATNYWMPETCFKYFEKVKIIKVSRDPRSVFYSMKFRQSFAYPGHDIKKFVLLYKEFMQKKIKIKKKYKNCILEIKFEDFINKFYTETKKLEKFLKLKKGVKNNFNYEFSKNNVYKAKNHLLKQELTFLKKELKNYLQW